MGKNKKKRNKKFFDGLEIHLLKEVSGEMIAEILEGKAEIHYGYYYLGDSKERVISKEYATSEEERERLSKTSFAVYGCIFKSLEEVKEAVSLFKERYRNTWYVLPNDRGKIKNNIKNILFEIRRK